MISRAPTIRLIPALLLFAASALEAATFTGIGDLPGGMAFSQAQGISADGSVVTGHSDATRGRTAFRWTAAGGMQSLGYLPGGSYSSGFDVSANGGVIVGSAATGGQNGAESRLEAFRWTATQGMQSLPGLGEDTAASHAAAVSANGEIVVGWLDTGIEIENDGTITEGYLWSATGGLTNIGTLPVAEYSSQALAVSASGTIIAGTSGRPRPSFSAIRWSADDGLTDLGNLGDVALSVAMGIDISADGSVIVGRVNSQSGVQAFRWNANGMLGLGDLPGGASQSWALATSENGNVIVGIGFSGAGAEAMIWTSTDGMRSLAGLLVAQGVSLDGWKLSDASAISNDGRIIVGSGTNPAGQVEAFIATVELP